MEKIKNLLTVPYKEENYKRFAIDFLKNMESVQLTENKNIHSQFKNAIESYTIFGKYTDDENKKIIVLSVKVKNNSSAQKAQRQFISYLLENEFGGHYNASLVAYYDEIRNNWKLSFVTIEYELKDNKLQLKYVPAKRFSFLVGQDEPTKTYIQQLNPIYESITNPTLSDITNAFSVSRLSKDFYEDYKRKYFELYDYLSENNTFLKEAERLRYKNKESQKRFLTIFCKKTLGQIMFLHFIQKKGWLGVTRLWGDGDKTYLINSTKEFVGNYFNDFLEPLFYEALNKKRIDDFYLNKKIPFLNGGLFQPIEDYDWKNTDFNIPNEYWFNDEETGLLNILAQYNFTVDEADPEEQEVAVDPEMLGKIFESLLDTNDRSNLGAFYTPREIVHFMCEESLAARLSKILNLDYESILNYVRYGDALKETEFIKEFAEDIDQYVSEFTIVDPAVGSGAFLVGMLNQIVKLRTNLLQFTNREYSKYELKLQTIQHSLYGVDLEYDAVEIAKLRLWLSLIVDEQATRRAPKPLPNLNFHLRVGNSLVDTYEHIKLWNTRWRGSKKEVKINNQMNIYDLDDVEVILKRLKDAKIKFFGISDEEEKQKLANQIEHEQIKLIQSELVKQNRFDLHDQILDMIKMKTKPFFIWELEFEEVFKNKKGFDIVIANPPYIQLQKNGGKLANELKDQGYKTFARTGDIYCLFYEKGIDLLKESGILCYITSNKWMRAGYGEKLRDFLAKNSNPLKLIDYGGNKIFSSATVDVNTLIAAKEENKGKTLSVIVDEGCINNLSDYLQQNYSINSFTNSDNWVVLSPIELSIKSKIEALGVKLEDWNISINRGILTGYNDAFIIDEKTKNMLISTDPKSAELIRPILRGKDIKRYSYEFANLWVINVPCGFTNKHKNYEDAESWFRNNYFSIYNYLKNTEEELAQHRKKTSKGLYKRDDQGDYWWELRSCKYLDDFYKQKIMYNDINKRLSFCLVESGIFCNNTVYFITANHHIKYLLGVLNSSLINWYYKTISVQLGKDAIRMFSIYVKRIPIPQVNEDIENVIISLVDKYLNTFDTSISEKIDDIIYKIFNLNLKEIEYIASL